jgi:hypothetical protein
MTSRFYWYGKYRYSRAATKSLAESRAVVHHGAITIRQGESRKTIALINFQPFLARHRKQPYPIEIEKRGCIIWELHTNVFKDPPDKGCQEWDTEKGRRS